MAAAQVRRRAGGGGPTPSLQRWLLVGDRPLASYGARTRAAHTLTDASTRRTGLPSSSHLCSRSSGRTYLSSRTQARSRCAPCLASSVASSSSSWPWSRRLSHTAATSRGEQQQHVEVLAEPKKEINGKHLEKIDLRVARIVAARAVEGADRLLELKLDVGGLAPPPPAAEGGKAHPSSGADHDEQRQQSPYRTVLSGIKAAYKPEELVGRHVIYVANLKPWKTPFGLSEGMILAASDPSGSQIFLSAVDAGAKPGMTVT